MTLISLPSAKGCKAFFTLGKHYEIQGQLGNGFIVLNDIDVPCLVLKERFE